jgi:homoserine dehydrogenase
MTEGVGVGLVGFGTIGTGVVKVLQQNRDVITSRLGFPLELRRIADRNIERDRGVDVSGIQLDDDVEALIDDPAISVVIELIGGYDAAKQLTLRAIEAGKHVVTANKALLAVHGEEIFAAARRRNVDIAFEASVGGGIPILRAMREGLSANRIEALSGIMNGTTNYVLTEMEKTGEDFEPVLARAQALGYAEADPSFDVDGVDAAHKLSLLVAMAFGAQLAFKEIPTEGIRGLTPLDFESAEAFGYRIKLLGIARLCHGAEGDRIEARVHPTMIPQSSLLANVDGAMNAIAVQGNAVGPTLYYGAGAGEMPTASAVVADLMEIAREIRRGTAGRVAPLSYPTEALRSHPLVPLSEVWGRAYLVFQAEDRPGVLGKIAGLLGEHEISIESVVQHGGGGGAAVPVVVLTHPAREGSLRDALARIDSLPDLLGPTRMIRIDEEI